MKKLISEIDRIKEMMGLISESVITPIERLFEKMGLKASAEAVQVVDRGVEKLLTKVKPTAFENALIKLSKITDEAALGKAIDSFLKNAANHVGIAKLIKSASPEVYAKLVDEYVAPRVQEIGKSLGKDSTDFSKFADESVVTKWADNLSQRYENAPLAKQFFEEWGQKRFKDMKLAKDLEGPVLADEKMIRDFVATQQGVYPTLFKKGLLGSLKNAGSVKALIGELFLKYKGKPYEVFLRDVDGIMAQNQEKLIQALGRDGAQEVNSFWKATKQAFSPFQKNILTGEAELATAKIIKAVLGLFTVITVIGYLKKGKGNVVKASGEATKDVGGTAVDLLNTAFGDSTGTAQPTPPTPAPPKPKKTANDY